MKLLPRKASATQVSGNENAAATMIHRRVEITVERETVSILVRGQLADGVEGCKEVAVLSEPYLNAEPVSNPNPQKELT